MVHMGLIGSPMSLVCVLRIRDQGTSLFEPIVCHNLSMQIGSGRWRGHCPADPSVVFCDLAADWRSWGGEKDQD